MNASVHQNWSTVEREGVPPSSNTGGKSESGTAGVIIDFLAFSFAGHGLPSGDVRDLVARMLGSWVGSFELDLVKRPGGLYGYKESWFIVLPSIGEAVQLGVAAYGGNGGSCYVSLTGTGTARVRDWCVSQGDLRTLDARVTRIDLAADFLEGEVGFEQACEAYKAGEFTGKGRTPSHLVMGDLLDETSTTGRTLYVGNRKNGKMFRGYEKGRQLGDAASEWFRAEVEFRAVDRVLDLEMLVEPAAHFAGAYEFCAGLVEVAAIRLRTVQAKAKIHLAKLMHHAQLAYGRLIALLQDAGAAPDDICATLRGDGLPRRLVETLSELKVRYGRWSLREFGVELERATAPF